MKLIENTNNSRPLLSLRLLSHCRSKAPSPGMINSLSCCKIKVALYVSSSCQSTENKAFVFQYFHSMMRNFLSMLTWFWLIALNYDLALEAISSNLLPFECCNHSREFPYGTGVHHWHSKNMNHHACKNFPGYKSHLENLLAFEWKHQKNPQSIEAGYDRSLMLRHQYLFSCLNLRATDLKMYKTPRNKLKPQSSWTVPLFLTLFYCLS